MPSEVVKALLHTQRILDELGIPSALMGGLAVAAWDHIRATDDVDLLVGIALTNAEELLKSFEARGDFRSKLFQAVVDFDGEHVLQMIYRPGGKFYEFPIDLFIAESEFHRAALARRTDFQVPDDPTVIKILTCEDLILFKLAANRIIDRRDVVSLLNGMRDQIDFAYLMPWLASLQVRAAWVECWQQAFPGEPDPTAVP